MPKTLDTKVSHKIGVVVDHAKFTERAKMPFHSPMAALG
jgi:hypothetical protein